MDRNSYYKSGCFAATLLMGLAVTPRSFGQTISIYPPAPSVRVGSTQTFTASWPGSNGAAATWAVNGIAGGNATVGTISSTGKYTPPATSAPGTVTVSASAATNPPAPGSTIVTLLNPMPKVTSISPTQINTGWNSFLINGTNFVSTSTATLGAQSLAVTYVSPTQLQFTGTITAAAGSSLPLTVTNPNPGSASASLTETVQPAITVSVSPTAPALYPNATQNFTATVANTSNHAVNWLVNGIPGGNSTVGTIVAGSSASQATYTSPAAPPNPNVVSVQAQSAQNTSVLSAAAQVTLNTASITLNPPAPAPRAGATVQFTATVKGVTPTTVTWAVNNIPGGNSTYGTISSTGSYIAPAAAPTVPVQVEAISTVNSAITGSVTVSLTNGTVTITSVTPAIINPGFNTNTIAGLNFVPGVTATLGGTPLTVVYNSATSLTVSGSTSAASGAQVTLTITNPNPGSSSASKTFTVSGGITISMSPKSVTLQTGASQVFTANVTNTTNKALTWLVNGVAGGNSTVGTISGTGSAGTYIAPATPPSSGAISVTAVSQQNPAVSSPAASVTVTNPSALISSVSPTTLNYGTATVQVTGSGFYPGATIMVGSVPLTTTVVSSTQLSGTGTLSPVLGQMAEVTVVNSGSPASGGVPVSFQEPNAQVSYQTAFHFLEQATWGPTPSDIDNLQKIGFTQWFAQQASYPLSTYNTSATALSLTQSDFFAAALSGQDQLRQRVAFALSGILCVSALKESTPAQMIPYLQLLESDALGNYYQILQDVTLSPTMGEYLDMADNYNPKNGEQPNQNYARELMQLFTIGPYMLNIDGTLQTDANGNPIPAYNDTTVQNFSSIWTGWTYSPAPGSGGAPFNPPLMGIPMVYWEPYHNTNSKTLLSNLVTSPNQTAQQDMATALQNIFNHPNVGPFVSYRLIQHLVESNPSPAYVERIANVFNNDGSGTRGNMMAVVQAILTDPEARDSDSPSTWLPNGGHLREPVLYLNAVMRELNTTVSGANQFGVKTGNMGEFLFSPPTVFSFYQPNYALPGFPTLYGPEYYLLDSSTALTAINWINSTATGSPGVGVSIDLSPFLQFGSDPQSLVTAMSNAFLAGQMPSQMQSAILTALGASTSPSQSVQIALYLTAASPFYMVQR